MKLLKHAQKTLFLFLMALPILASAGGTYVPGTVGLADNGNYMTGSFNVRYNPAVSQGHVTILWTPDVSFEISGKSSFDGAEFNCSFVKFIDQEKFYAWEDTLREAGNGTLLLVRRVSADDPTCTEITLGIESALID